MNPKNDENEEPNAARPHVVTRARAAAAPASNAAVLDAALAGIAPALANDDEGNQIRLKLEAVAKKSDVLQKKSAAVLQDLATYQEKKAAVEKLSRDFVQVAKDSVEGMQDSVKEMQDSVKEMQDLGKEIKDLGKEIKDHPDLAMVMDHPDLVMLCQSVLAHIDALYETVQNV